MTLDELKGLRKGEVVVITKVDEISTGFKNYQVDDELTFIGIDLTPQYAGEISNEVKFIRKLTDDEEKDNPNAIGIILHFSYNFCNYIERKIILEREKKLNNLGI